MKLKFNLNVEIAKEKIAVMVADGAENATNWFKNKNKTQINALIEKAYKEIKEELFPQNVKLQKYIEKNLKTIVDIMANYSFRTEN